MLNILGTLLGGATELGKTYLNNKAEEKQAKHTAIPIFMVGYAIIVNDVTVIDRVEQGFVALEGLPEWYQYLLFLAISSSFGIRGVSKIMGLKK